MYAAANGIEPSTVCLQDVEKSKEGLLHWACHQLQLTAHSPATQRCKRALKNDAKAMEIFADLDPDLKQEFVARYNLANNLEFSQVEREETLSFTQLEEKVGKYYNHLQLCRHFGGVDQQDAINEALDVERFCEQLGEPWATNHPVSKRRYYLFVDYLINTRWQFHFPCFSMVSIFWLGIFPMLIFSFFIFTFLLS